MNNALKTLASNIFIDLIYRGYPDDIAKRTRGLVEHGPELIKLAKQLSDSIAFTNGSIVEHNVTELLRTIAAIEGKDA